MTHYFFKNKPECFHFNASAHFYVKYLEGERLLILLRLFKLARG